jgi:hypothetical protein
MWSRIDETFSFPDVGVSPESQPPGVELYDLGVIDEKVHVPSERLQVPFEDGRV